jgi:hypothetical protein
MYPLWFDFEQLQNFFTVETLRREENYLETLRITGKISFMSSHLAWFFTFCQNSSFSQGIGALVQRWG